MQTATLLRNRCLQALVATALATGLGAVSAYAQSAGNTPANAATQGQGGAPSKATCEKEAKE